MNPNETPPQNNPTPTNPPQPPVETGETAPTSATTENMTTNSTSVAPQQTQPAQPLNPQVPPAPAEHIVQQEPPQVIEHNELPPNNPTVIDEQIALKKNQARKLVIAAGIFISIFVLGVIAVIVIALGDTEETTNLTTDEQIAADINTLGLGLINYSNNNSSDFSLEPVNVGELKVSYLPIEFTDPRTEEPYVLTTEIPTEGELQYVLGGVCNEDDSISQSGSGGNFAIRALLENGTLYCIQRSEVEVPATPQP